MTQPVDAKILIVDDYVANVLVLQGILEDRGYTQIQATSDARRALALYQEFQPDLILLDLHMPHLDGLAVMEQLRAVSAPDSAVPIVILTADDTPETVAGIRAAGADGILSKPLNVPQFIKTVEILLQRTVP